METHHDLIMKNVPFGGKAQETVLVVREAWANFLEDKTELRGLLGRLNMVDVPRTSDTQANVFLCFENFWNHRRALEIMRDKMWFIILYRKRINTELGYFEAKHGAEYTCCTWVHPNYHEYVPRTNISRIARLLRPPTLEEQLKTAKEELKAAKEEAALNKALAESLEDENKKLRAKMRIAYEAKELLKKI